MPRPRPTPSRRALRLLTGWLHGAHRAALRHPRATLLLAAALALASAAALPRTRVHLSIREMADPSLPSAAWAAEDEAIFGGGHQLILILAPRAEGGRLEAADLSAIRGWLSSERARNPEIVRVASPFDAVVAARVDGRLRLVPALAADTPEALAALSTGPSGGLLTSRDGRDVALDLTLRPTPGGSAFGRVHPAVVAGIERRAREELLSARPGLALHLGGAAAFDHFAFLGLQRFQALNALVLLLLLGVMRLLFGTWRSGLLLAGVVAFAGLVVHGAMAAAGEPMDLLSTGLFLMLSVAAVEDFVYLSHLQLTGGTGWRHAFRRLLLPGFLTSLTTVIGFSSLCVSDLATVRAFGLWGGLGAALEWAVTFLALPALLQLRPGLRRWTEPRRALGAGAWTRLGALSLPRPAAWAALSVLGLAAAASADLTFADSPAAMFPAGHPFRQALDHAEASRGWLAAIDLVFPEGATAAEVERTARALEADPAVARVLDPVSLRRAVVGDDPLAPFELASDPAAAGAGDGLTAPDGRMRASVLLRRADLLTMQALRDRLAARFPGGDGFPAGDLVTYADVGGAVPRTLLHSLLTCLALVGGVIAWLFRALGRPGGLRAVAASFWGPAVALLALWAWRVPVNFVSVSFASVLVGLCGDNAVQFACAASRGPLSRGIDRRAGAATLVVVVMGLCALTFLGSAFLPPRRLGLLLAAGLVAALLGDVVVLGALTRGRPGAAYPPT